MQFEQEKSSEFLAPSPEEFPPEAIVPEEEIIIQAGTRQLRSGPAANQPEQ